MASGPRPHIRGAAGGIRRRKASARKASLAGVAALFGAASLARKRAERRAKVAAARRAIRSAVKKAKAAARAQVREMKRAAHKASVARRRAARKEAGAEARARKKSAHKKEVAARRAARKAARAHARAAAKARRAALRQARKAGAKRYSLVHKSSKIPAVGSKSQVYKGLARHTSGGLTKSQIVRKTIRRGNKVVHRYMSKKRASLAKRRGLPKALVMWRMALRQVGATKIPKKGTSLYQRAKAAYSSLMKRPTRSAPARVRRVRRSGARRVRTA